MARHTTASKARITPPKNSLGTSGHDQPDPLMEAFIIVLLVLFIIAVFYFVSRTYWNYFTGRMGIHDDLHRHGRHPDGRLRGCTRNGECPNGNFCYNCEGPNATCCCYDSQCKVNAEEARAESDPSSPYFGPETQPVPGEKGHGHHHHKHQHGNGNNKNNGNHEQNGNHHKGHHDGQHSKNNTTPSSTDTSHANDNQPTMELQMLQNHIDKINERINKENQLITKRNEKYAHN